MKVTLKSKTLAVSYLFVLTIATILSLYMPKNEATASEAVVIPKEAIRLRILANSDLESDQAIKRLVRDEVNANITEWVQDLTSLDDARNIIQSKLPEIQMIADEVVKREGADQTVNIEFGKVRFPTKLYGQFLYPAGEYEAILITLGEGKGANWWCVLFPPLCFLDFSNGVAVSDGFDGRSVREEGQLNGKKEIVTPAENSTQKEQTKTNPTNKISETEESSNSLNQGEQTEKSKEEPIYVAEAEEKVKVKFFLKELWMKLF